MKVKLHKDLASVQIIEASTVVIEDATGTPVAVATEHSPGIILASVAGNADFQQLLNLAGVRRTVYVQKANQQALSSVQFD